MSGRIELTAGGRIFGLQAGDSFSFDSRLRHRYANPSASNEAIVVWANTPITLRP